MYFFIINPSSSSGCRKHIWKHLQHLLNEKNIAYRAAFTHQNGDAQRLAAQASSKASPDFPVTVVAVGGDGTASEVLNGLVLSKHLTFGYIPTGSGNDLAKGLSLAVDAKEALSRILAPSDIRSIRVGKVKADDGTCRRFFISSGMGFDAAVCQASCGSRLKQFLNLIGAGRLVYLATALRMLIKLKGSPVSLKLDEERFLSFPNIFFCAFMNLSYEGGGFMFCPDADPEDSFLDICLIRNIPKWRIPLLLPTAFSGKHIRYTDYVSIYRCKKAVIQTDTALYVHTDGENLGPCRRLEVSLEPEAVSFICS